MVCDTTAGWKAKVSLLFPTQGLGKLAFPAPPLQVWNPISEVQLDVSAKFPFNRRLSAFAKVELNTNKLNVADSP